MSKVNMNGDRIVFIDSLPRTEYGKINWIKSVGHEVYFQYGEIKDKVKIIKYDKEYLTLLYNNSEFIIRMDSFVKCRLGNMVNVISKKFKLEKDTIIKNVTIIKRKYKKVKCNNGSLKNEKWYKYRCNICNNEGWTIETQLLHGKSVCNMCSNSTSYPERLMFSILKNLEINFKTQLTKTTFEWCKNYRYDFYFKLNGEDCICETHGMQHYDENTNFRMSLYEVQENDKLKKELALNNGIKEENYIVIDCRYSELEFIKQNILKSRLNKLSDLSKIDWKECNESALRNKIYEVCDLWNNGNSVKEISLLLKISEVTIRKYLKDGEKCNKCIYDAHNIRVSVCGKSNCKKIHIKKDNKIIYQFNSITELIKLSKEYIGERLSESGVYRSLRNNKPYKGYTFSYVY